MDKRFVDSFTDRVCDQLDVSKQKIKELEYKLKYWKTICDELRERTEAYLYKCEYCYNFDLDTNTKHPRITTVPLAICTECFYAVCTECWDNPGNKFNTYRTYDEWKSRTVFCSECGH